MFNISHDAYVGRALFWCLFIFCRLLFRGDFWLWLRSVLLNFCTARWGLPVLRETDLALTIKPNCEFCDRDLPPDSPDACICSYECTFCRQCVETKLQNVCPNCGGGFQPRPIRPLNEWRQGVSLGNHPASEKRVSLSYDHASIERLVRRVRDIPPHER